MPTFHVRLVRPRFDVAIIEVNDAKHMHNAVIKAIASAKALPDEEREQEPFDESSYSLHVQDIHELTEDSVTDEDRAFYGELKEEFFAIPRQPEYARYLLLYADLENGEGTVLMQPWILREDGLMQADLCGDWETMIGRMGEHGAVAMVNEVIDELEGSKHVSAQDYPAWLLRSPHDNDNNAAQDDDPDDAA